MNTDVYVATAGLLGVLAASYIGWLRLRTEKKKGASLLRRATADGPTFLFFITEWSEILQMVEVLFEETHVDRFLMLEARNGTKHPDRVTAFFQLRTEGQRAYPYKNYLIDNPYRTFLEQCESSAGGVYMDVPDMPDSGIKSIYEAENVQSAIWFYLGDEQLSDASRRITFCSFGSHEGPMDATTRVRCNIIADRIRQFTDPKYST